MKKKICEEYTNPVRSRFVAEYNKMSEEQQRLFDAYDDLPEEKKRLKPIKRKRKGLRRTDGRSLFFRLYEGTVPGGSGRTAGMSFCLSDGNLRN